MTFSPNDSIKDRLKKIETAADDFTEGDDPGSAMIIKALRTAKVGTKYQIEEGFENLEIITNCVLSDDSKDAPDLLPVEKMLLLAKLLKAIGNEISIGARRNGTKIFLTVVY